MQNVRKSQLKTCIFMTEEEFTDLGIQVFGAGFNPDIDLEGILCQVGDDVIETEVLHTTLAKHFDVSEITSIHVDDCDYTGVWICYKDTK